MIAQLLALARRDADAAAVLDDWIEEQGGRWSSTFGGRGIPLAQLLFIALHEAGDVGLRRSDLVLLGYRSRYPRCTVEEANKHRTQNNVWIRALMREWGHQTSDRRWHLRPQAGSWKTGKARR
jgi:hypothetical protein